MAGGGGKPEPSLYLNCPPLFFSFPSLPPPPPLPILFPFLSPALLPPPPVRRVAPRFSILPMSHEIMPGGNVNITCVAVGSPMPYVKWMQGAEDLTPEDDMPVGRNVLELTDVKDSANYTCVAMSSLGVIEAVAQITVKCECGVGAGVGGHSRICGGHGGSLSCGWRGNLRERKIWGVHLPTT